jgi:hypothetical protein
VKNFCYAICVAIGALTLTVCAAESTAITSNAASSPHTAQDMGNLYYDTGKDCGGNTAPAFLCSGIIIRETARPVAGQSYYFWQPSPSSLHEGAVSFSYIRHDARFDKFKSNGSHGYTLYPLLGKYRYSGSDRKIKLDVLCSFPLDGWTDYRQNEGCGPDTTYLKQSSPCQGQGITTAQQWLTQYKSGDGGLNQSNGLYQNMGILPRLFTRLSRRGTCSMTFHFRNRTNYDWPYGPPTLIHPCCPYNPFSIS